MKPNFKPGTNIAMKVPSHEYESTIRFYDDVLGLSRIPGPAPDSPDSVRFDFEGKILWIDKVAALSQAEIWLEIISDDVDGASQYLEMRGCIRRDEIEALPDDFKGFWISGPSNIIHLVTQGDAT